VKRVDDAGLDGDGKPRGIWVRKEGGVKRALDGRRWTVDGRRRRVFTGIAGGTAQRAVATGFVVVVELGVDDLEFLALADGGDEGLEDSRVEHGIDARAPEGDALTEGGVVEVEPIGERLIELLDVGQDGFEAGTILESCNGAEPEEKPGEFAFGDGRGEGRV
jgi:hypothetical protein